MDKEYQKKEVMKDLWNKEERIKALEKELTEVVTSLEKATKKLNIALEGLSHIDDPIARDTEKEIFEA